MKPPRSWPPSPPSLAEAMRTIREKASAISLLRKLRYSTNRLPDVMTAVLVLHHASA
ncbi:hypothetical protein [Streptomyces sp. Qhu_M48]|uniref:hypothetical protein n=1 Tax=Streptomyces sp. Qhu_M48 TaxID=3435889 RepID=UPI003F4FD650